MLFRATFIAALLATSLPAHAGKVRLPNSGDVVPIKTEEFTVIAHRIVGTIFGKQVWILVEEEDRIDAFDPDCDARGCWLYYGNL